MRDYHDDTEHPCPECGEGTLRFGGYENYGADADGRRGMPIPYFGCDRCGYEEGGVPY